MIASCLGELPSPAAPGNGWVEVSNKPGLVIYCREKKDSQVKEYKATGEIVAPAWVVKNVIDDVENYAHFMPYVTESTVLAREGESLVTYQRFTAPMVSDRDYILRIQFESHPAPGGGTVYCNKWKGTTGYGPEEKHGVIRVKVNEGYWLLEPTGETTRATYMIFTDPGGAIPAMVINYGNKNAIPKLFASVQKQAGNPKYSEKKPAVAH
ncbi:MAG: START domain-containing protein [Verrucomicrobiota bacterium]